MPSSTSSSASSHSSQRSLQPASSAGAAAVASAPGATQRRPDPHSVINLRLILVSGKTKDFQFRPSESAGDIAQYVFDSWPSGESVEWYSGRFVHRKLTI